MTIFTHALWGAALGQLAQAPVWPCVLLSALPDLDHLFLAALGRKFAWEHGGFVGLRSWLHELGGVVAASVLFALVYALTRNPAVLVYLFCVVFHLFLDFLSGTSFPFRALNQEGHGTVCLVKDRPARLLLESLVLVLGLLLYVLG